MLINRPSSYWRSPEVGDAWIGVTLQTSQKSAKYWKGFGVLSTPSSALLQVWQMITGRAIRVVGFSVNAQAAVDLLAVTQPAAAWWRSNTPKLLDGRQRFAFDAEACVVLDDV